MSGDDEGELITLSSPLDFPARFFSLSLSVALPSPTPSSSPCSHRLSPPRRLNLAVSPLSLCQFASLVLSRFLFSHFLALFFVCASTYLFIYLSIHQHYPDFSSIAASRKRWTLVTLTGYYKPLGQRRRINKLFSYTEKCKVLLFYFPLALKRNFSLIVPLLTYIGFPLYIVPWND